MTHNLQPAFRARLVRRLQRSDPFLIRAIQAAALIGCVLGMLLWSWQAVRTDAEDAQRGLRRAAATGQVAAQADLARIDAAALSLADILAPALEAEATPDVVRSAQFAVTEALRDTPVVAVVAFNDQGTPSAVFGQLPSDAAAHLGPQPESRRAGSELLSLEFARLSDGRLAAYRTLPLADGREVSAALVLRTDTFYAALEAGAAAGPNWRAALVNRDGDLLLTSAAKGTQFLSQDAALGAQALGWSALHEDEARAAKSARSNEGERFIETRSVPGDSLHIIYIGEAAPVMSVLADRRFEFLALLGAALLAVALAVSIVQNEWQRHDRHVRDADLMAARAEVTCDLLAAGVIDWSVSDGLVDYSEGWAELFSQGVEPSSEQIFDWVGRIHTDDQAAARQAYQQMLDGDTTELVHRFRVRLSSGLWVQVIERGRAIGSVDGRAKRIVLVQTIEAADGSQLRSALETLMPVTAIAV